MCNLYVTAVLTLVIILFIIRDCAREESLLSPCHKKAIANNSTARESEEPAYRGWDTALFAYPCVW